MEQISCVSLKKWRIWVPQYIKSEHMRHRPNPPPPPYESRFHIWEKKMALNN